MPTRDELKQDINKAIDEQFPENIDLDGDDLDTVETTVETVLEQATTAMDGAEDEDESETEKV